MTRIFFLHLAFLYLPFSHAHTHSTQQVKNLQDQPEKFKTYEGQFTTHYPPAYAEKSYKPLLHFGFLYQQQEILEQALSSLFPGALQDPLLALAITSDHVLDLQGPLQLGVYAEMIGGQSQAEGFSYSHYALGIGGLVRTPRFVFWSQDAVNRGILRLGISRGQWLGTPGDFSSSHTKLSLGIQRELSASWIFGIEALMNWDRINRSSLDFTSQTNTSLQFGGKLSLGYAWESQSL